VQGSGCQASTARPRSRRLRPFRPSRTLSVDVSGLAAGKLMRARLCLNSKLSGTR
jgi:hypothetical protein